MTPPAPWSRDLALLRTWGEEDIATHLLEQLNRVQRALGLPDYAMPEPLETGLPDLVTCESRVRSIVERDLRFTVEKQKRDAA